METVNKENKDIKVLIVDDDKFLLTMYSKKFENKGYNVESLLSSTSALEKLRAGQKYDIILLDVVIPKINGLELLKIIRDEKLATESIIVMLTNQGQKEDIDEARKFDIDGYIVKAAAIPSEILAEVEKIYKEKKESK